MPSSDGGSAGSSGGTEAAAPPPAPQILSTPEEAQRRIRQARKAEYPPVFVHPSLPKLFNNEDNVSVLLVDKVDHRKKTQKRVLLVTRFALYLCDLSGTAKRFLKWSQVAKVNARQLNGVWELHLPLDPPEHDMVLRIPPDERNPVNPVDEQELRQVLGLASKARHLITGAGLEARFLPPDPEQRSLADALDDGRLRKAKEWRTPKDALAELVRAAPRGMPMLVALSGAACAPPPAPDPEPQPQAPPVPPPPPPCPREAALLRKEAELARREEAIARRERALLYRRQQGEVLLGGVEFCPQRCSDPVRLRVRLCEEQPPPAEAAADPAAPPSPAAGPRPRRARELSELGASPPPPRSPRCALQPPVRDEDPFGERSFWASDHFRPTPFAASSAAGAARARPAPAAAAAAQAPALPRQLQQRSPPPLRGHSVPPAPYETRLPRSPTPAEIDRWAADRRLPL